MRYDHAAPAVALLTLFGACTEGPTSLAPETDALVPLMDATAAPTRSAFEGFIYFCTNPPPPIWFTPGGTAHFRNTQNTNEWVVGNPLIDGFETNEVDANLDLKSGVGFAHGKGTLVPAAVAGTWELDFHVNMLDGSSSGTGRGTGDLQGMSMAWESSGGLVFDNPCSSLPGVPVTGIITTPGGP
ncbi:MAG: hypothetical protein ACYTA3_00525 [Planctomycetota bacterium]|jgi:hypothetical protein